MRATRTTATHRDRPRHLVDMRLCIAKIAILPAYGRRNSARSGGPKPPVRKVSHPSARIARIQVMSLARHQCSVRPVSFSSARIALLQRRPQVQPRAGGVSPPWETIALLGENRSSAMASVHAIRSGGRKPPVGRVSSRSARIARIQVMSLARHQCSVRPVSFSSARIAHLQRRPYMQPRAGGVSPPWNTLRMRTRNGQIHRIAAADAVSKPRRVDARGAALKRLPSQRRYSHPRRADARRSCECAFVHRTNPLFFRHTVVVTAPGAGDVSPPWNTFRMRTRNGQIHRIAVADAVCNPRRAEVRGVERKHSQLQRRYSHPRRADARGS
jgi:hypothetical protein